MSDKESKIEDIDEDLDFDDFDMDDFDIGFGDEDTSSKSDKEMLKEGAWEALKEQADPEHLGRLLREQLPDSLRSSIESALRVGDEITDMTNDNIERFNKHINQWRITTSKVLPKFEKTIPESIRNLLQKFADGKEEFESTQLTEEQAQREAMMNELRDFQEVQIKTHEMDEARDALRDVEEAKRYETQRDTLYAIRNAISKQTAFAEQVTAKYYYKNLEIGYRQLIVQTNLFKAYLERSDKSNTMLKELLENSKLTDLEKLRYRHNTDSLFKKAVSKGLGFDQWESGFSNKLLKNIKSTISSKVSDVLNMSDMGRQGLEMLSMFGDMGGKEADARFQVAKALTSFGLNWGTSKVFKKISDVADKDGKLSAIGLKLGSYDKNLPTLLNRFVKDGLDETNLFPFLKDLIRNIVPTQSVSDANYGLNSIDKLNDVVPFDRLTKRSIVDVIPELLSSIHLSTEGIRKTINPNQKLNLEEGLHYDFNKGKLQTKATFMEEALPEYQNKLRLNEQATDISHLLNILDPDNALPSELRFKLAKSLMTNLGSAKGFEPEDILNKSFKWHGGKPTPQQMEIYEGVLKQNFKLAKSKKGHWYDSAYTDKEIQEKRADMRRHFNNAENTYSKVSEDLAKNFVYNDFMANIGVDLGYTSRKNGYLSTNNIKLHNSENAFNDLFDTEGNVVNAIDYTDPEKLKRIKKEEEEKNKGFGFARLRALAEKVAKGEVDKEEIKNSTVYKFVKKTLRHTLKIDVDKKFDELIENYHQTVGEKLHKVTDKLETISNAPGNIANKIVDKVSGNKHFRKLADIVEHPDLAPEERLEKLKELGSEVTKEVKNSDTVKELKSHIDTASKAVKEEITEIRKEYSDGGASNVFNNRKRIYKERAQKQAKNVKKIIKERLDELNQKIDETTNSDIMKQTTKLMNDASEIISSDDTFENKKKRLGKILTETKAKIISKVKVPSMVTAITDAIMEQYSNLVKTHLEEEAQKPVKEKRKKSRKQSKRQKRKERAKARKASTVPHQANAPNTQSNDPEPTSTYQDDDGDIYEDLDIPQGFFTRRMTNKLGSLKEFMEGNGIADRPIYGRMQFLHHYFRDTLGIVSPYQPKRRVIRDDIPQEYVPEEMGVGAKIKDLVTSPDFYKKGLIGGMLFGKNFGEDFRRKHAIFKDTFLDPDKDRPIVDIYVRGEDSPRLLATKIAQGDYVLKDDPKKVVKYVEDITGPVIDRQGNVMIEVADFEKGIVDFKGEKTLTTIQQIWKRRLSLTGMVIDPIVLLPKLAGKLAKGALKTSMGATDYYLGGERFTEGPILTRWGFLRGSYHNKDGSRIYSLKDIKGPVYDRMGNLIVTPEEIKQFGLYDKKGRKASSYFLRRLRFAKDILGFIGGNALSRGMARFAKKTASKAIRTGFNAIGTLGEATFGKYVPEGSQTFGSMMRGAGSTLSYILTGKRDNKQHRTIDGVEVDERTGKRVDHEKNEYKKVKAQRKQWERENGIGILNKIFHRKDRKGSVDEIRAHDDDADHNRRKQFAEKLKKLREAQEKQSPLFKMIKRGLEFIALPLTAMLKLFKGNEFLGMLFKPVKWGVSKLGTMLLGGLSKVMSGTWKAVKNKVAKKGAKAATEAGVKTAEKVAGKQLEKRGARFGFKAAYESLGNLAKGAVVRQGEKTVIKVGFKAGLAATGLVLGPILGVALAAWTVWDIGSFLYDLYHIPTKIDDFRAANYGINPENEDMVKTVLKLEQAYEKHSSVDDDFNVSIGQLTKEEYKECLYNFFGGKEGAAWLQDAANNNPDAYKEVVGRFEAWHEKRFKPIFAQHLRALKMIDRKATLKESFGRMSSWPTGYYNSFVRLAILGNLGDTVDSNPYLLQVDPFVLRAIQSNDSDFAKDNQYQNGLSLDDVRHYADIVVEAYKSDEQKLKSKNQIDMKAGKGDRFAFEHDNVTANASYKDAKTGKTNRIGSKQENEKLANTISTTTSNVKDKVSLDTKSSLMRFEGTKEELLDTNGRIVLTNFKAARYKIYGLVKFTTTTVQAYQDLEDALLKECTVSAKDVSIGKENLDKLVNKVAKSEAAQQMFKGTDKENLTPVNGHYRVKFTDWFYHRFFPVFKIFAINVYSITKANDLLKASETLKPEDQLSLITKMSNATTGLSSYPSVWQIDGSFGEYSGNTDSATINTNIKAIKDKVKEVLLTDPGKKDNTDKSKIDIKNLIEVQRKQRLANIRKFGGKTGLQPMDILQGKTPAPQAFNEIVATNNLVQGAESNEAQNYMKGIKPFKDPYSNVSPSERQIQVAKELSKQLAKTDWSDEEKRLFMAIATVESGGLSRLTEKSYSTKNLSTDVLPGGKLYYLFGKRRMQNPNLWDSLVANGDNWEAVYGGWNSVGKMLGNTDKGDGSKYKGRGIIQLTGKTNYEKIGNQIGESLSAHPEKVADPALAVKSAIGWWNYNKKAGNRNLLAGIQNNDITKVAMAVSGAHTPSAVPLLNERIGYFNEYENNQGLIFDLFKKAGVVSPLGINKKGKTENKDTDGFSTLPDTINAANTEPSYDNPKASQAKKNIMQSFNKAKQQTTSVRTPAPTSASSLSKTNSNSVNYPKPSGSNKEITAIVSNQAEQEHRSLVSNRTRQVEASQLKLHKAAADVRLQSLKVQEDQLKALLDLNEKQAKQIEILTKLLEGDKPKSGGVSVPQKELATQSRNTIKRKDFNQAINLGHGNR